ncbi:MAG: MarR family transcriptional regulator [Euryarchaeota archaeon]|nr:MarR family transcriptional regulator [Euryarchaeota archaeon]
MKARKVRIEIMTEEQEIEATARSLERIAKRATKKREDNLIFRDAEALRSFLTSERLRLLTLIRHERPASVYELAKLAKRDRKSVTTDLDILEGLGLVQLESVKGAGRTRSVPHVGYERIEIGVEV